ncbi:MAG: sulfite exporter TauE/SafE family protein [Planctomycetes bacterium]|nr:sulfite exporter TauE/SafE family protein [Planctomycetota bacterium]MCH8119701.1 sulfite exporter TauE/SafE family protein [Planctomycetota bacterium]
MIGQLSNPWWVFIVLGLCAGVLSGALGLGSGIIMIPTLVLLCGFGQKSAQGMALAVMVPMALVGALRYWKNPEIEFNTVIVGLIICGALAGALAGTELASRIPNHILRKVFATVLVIAAIKMFMTSAKPGQPNLDNSLIEQKIVSSLENGETNNEPEI